SVPYGEWKKKNDSLTAGKEVLERELARALKPGSLRDILADYKLADFCALAKEDEAMIDIYRYQALGEPAEKAQKYAAVVSSRQGPLALVDFGSSRDVDASLMAWRKQVLVKNEAASEWDALSSAVWKKVAAVL